VTIQQEDKTLGIVYEKVRKTLSGDALLKCVRKYFDSNIKDHRAANASISLTDSIMSGLAIYSLKEHSLLAFERDLEDSVFKNNFEKVFSVKNIPSDTALREILDPVEPLSIKPIFKATFRELQRGKVLEDYVFKVNNTYLLSVDGTEYFSSDTVHCENCQKKEHKDGEITYSHSMLSGVILYPKKKEVIPVVPEPIIKQDGETKNDCEINALKRFLVQFRKEHPKLEITILLDSLYSKAPVVQELSTYGINYIIGVKQSDHKFLFETLNNLESNEKAINHLIITEDGKEHKFRFINKIALNKSNPDLLTNFIEYWETDKKKDKQIHFSWITDIEITKENVYEIMRAGRARWKIENETFNTLKNQGYNFEHNFGHGEKNLSVNMALLMMLAFLIDQTQQICCPLYKAAIKVKVVKKDFFESIREVFHRFAIESWKMILEAVRYGIEVTDWKIKYNSC